MSEQVSDQTSSIGISWPPVESSNQRLKGFYDCYIQTDDDVDVFVGHYKQYESDVLNSESLGRLSLRAVVSTPALPMLEESGLTLEASLPIKGRDDSVVIYMGTNKPGREVPATIINSHKDNLREITAKDPEQRDHHSVFASHGLAPRIISKSTPTHEKNILVDRFVELYSAFGYNGVDVEVLLSNPSNAIAFVENEDGVVSTGMAEQATVEISGYGSLEIAEITEAVTREEYTKKGLYRAISGYLVRSLVEDSGTQLDIIYGESNLAMKGVLIAAHQNGRNFSFFDRATLGIKNEQFGILPQHFHVEDKKEERPYNDFALSYVPMK